MSIDDSRFTFALRFLHASQAFVALERFMRPLSVVPVVEEGDLSGRELGALLLLSSSPILAV